MSFLNRIRPCPCATWRCRAFYAGRVLAAAVLIAGIASDIQLARAFGWI